MSIKIRVCTVNNANKIYPPVYLIPEEIQIEGHVILHIYVPAGTQVCRNNGRIFDRSYEADLDITDNSDAVYRLYARKQDSYYVNKVRNCLEITSHIPCLFLRERCSKISYIARYAPDF